MRDFVTVGQKPLLGESTGSAESHLTGRRRGFGLATRTLLLVVAFIMLSEIAIYIPILANYHDNLLRRHLSAAYTASLVLEAAPRAMVSEQLSSELLKSVGARIIVLEMHGTRRILAASTLPPQVDEFYDLRHATFLQSLAST